MAFKLFSIPIRQSFLSIVLVCALYQVLPAQNNLDLSVHSSHARKSKWLSGETHSEEQQKNEFDNSPRNGKSTLFTTLSPHQFARQTEILQEDLAKSDGLIIRSRKGVQLLALQADQLISLQSLLLGKVYDPTFFKQEILKVEGISHSSLNKELLSQVLALQLNRLSATNKALNAFRIEFDAWLVTQQVMFSENSLNAAAMPCGSGMDSRIVYSWKFPVSLKSLLGSENTVQDLQDLAIEVLAGQRLATKTEVDDIEEGIRIINEAFESGRYLLGWSDQFITCSNSWIFRWKLQTPATTVPVRQDVFTTSAVLKTMGEDIRLEVNAVESSKVLIELYTEKGSRIKKFFHDRLKKGEHRSFLVNKKGGSGAMIYKVTADGRTYSGLIP